MLQGIERMKRNAERLEALSALHKRHITQLETGAIMQTGAAVESRT